MLLAVLPLFFAWRSLASYFYCAAYPIFILMAAQVPSSKKLQPKETSYQPVSLLPTKSQGLLSEVPAAASIQA